MTTTNHIDEIKRVRSLRNERGFVIHKGQVEGENFVVIATMQTSNRKTGNMIQVWFLLEDHKPTDVVNSGLDAKTICRGCKFASKNGCYVNVGQAPSSIWKAYHRGAYKELTPKDYQFVFGARTVRFGAYGNPSLLPISKVKAIAKSSTGWTGYFHDWREMAPATRKAYGQFFMASTETSERYDCATKMGLRSFHVSPVKPEGSMECLSDAKGLSCEQCKLCSGLEKSRLPNVWINPHGATKKRAEKVAMA